MPTEAKTVALKEVKNILGVTFKFGDTECATLVSVLVLVVALVLFSALSIWNINRKKQFEIFDFLIFNFRIQLC